MTNYETSEMNSPLPRAGGKTERVTQSNLGRDTAQQFGPAEWGMTTAVAITWGASFLFIAIAIDHVATGVVPIARLGFGALALACFPAARKRIDRKDMPRVAMLGFVAMTIPFYLYPLAEQSVSSSVTGMIMMDEVFVPEENRLPGVRSLAGPFSCLNRARYGIAWGAIGAAMDCYDTALRYSKERVQFGKPIAGFQLQQKKLAEMITEITKAQLLTYRLGQLKNDGKATSPQISMAKRNNVDMALTIARDARQMLGGMGITGEYPIMRHMMNLESVVTYEGTHDIHLLITGMDVTGIAAFK